MAVLAVRAQLGSVGRSTGSSPRLSGMRHSARGLPALRRIVCRSSEAEPAVGGGSPPGSTNSGGGGDGGDGNGGNGAAAGGAILAGRAIESLPAGGWVRNSGEATAPVCATACKPVLQSSNR